MWIDFLENFVKKNVKFNRLLKCHNRYFKGLFEMSQQRCPFLKPHSKFSINSEIHKFINKYEYQFNLLNILYTSKPFNKIFFPNMSFFHPTVSFHVCVYIHKCIKRIYALIILLISLWFRHTSHLSSKSQIFFFLLLAGL